MTQRICDGLTVIEAGAGSIAGSMIGMMLADNGAHVVKLEPPEGDPLRSGNVNGFLAWNRGKDSQVCDLRTNEGQAQARDLIAKADVFIDGFGTGVTDGWGLGYEALKASNPALVYCAIRGFASTGPYAHLPAYEAIVAAKSGVFTRGMFAYRPGPQFANELLGSHGAAHMGVSSVLAALIVRDKTGKGQRVEASMYQGLSPFDYFGVVTIQAMRQAMAKQAASGEQPKVGVSASRYTFIPCTKDGRWMVFCTLLPHQLQALARACGVAHVLEDPRFKDAPYFQSAEDADEFEQHVWEAVRQMTAAELMERVLAEPDVACEIAGTTEEAMQHAQVLHNHHVVEVEDPRLGTIKEIGPIARFLGSPSVIDRSAPAIGEQTREVRRSSSPAGAAPLPKHPLEGITIVEFGYFYAMPNGTTLAAALGARVIKIEDQRGDPQRWSFGIRETGGSKVMEGKESFAIDLRKPEGQAVIHKILETADVFVCGFRPGVAEKMNLGYDKAKEINPGIVYLHAGGYGYDGPQSHRAMYAQIATAVAGGFHRQSGMWLDPAMADGMSVDELRVVLAPRINSIVTGDANASLGVLSGLLFAIYHQHRTGQGQFVSTTMLNGNLYGTSDDFITYEGKPPLPLMDPEQWGLNALYRCYPAAEGHVCLAAPTEKAWQALVAALGQSDLANDSQFADVAARKEHDEALIKALEAVFQAKPAQAWEDELIPKGIACVKVTEVGAAQFAVDDPGLRESGLTFEIDEPTFGRIVREGLPATFSETPGRLGIPCLTGEHTDALLQEYGYSDEEITRLKEAGVVFDQEACKAQ
ncbi:MAG: CoA transferase [Acidobacteria bacterium]|nr:CoA transferase [Acidobacteriota bacterium]